MTDNLWAASAWERKEAGGVPRATYVWPLLIWRLWPGGVVPTWLGEASDGNHKQCPAEVSSPKTSLEVARSPRLSQASSSALADKLAQTLARPLLLFFRIKSLGVQETMISQPPSAKTTLRAPHAPPQPSSLPACLPVGLPRKRVSRLQPPLPCSPWAWLWVSAAPAFWQLLQ